MRERHFPRHLPPNFFGFVDEMPGMSEEFPAATA
jgi:hypothetical protein